MWIIRCFRNVEQSVNARSHTSQTNLRNENLFTLAICGSIPTSIFFFTFFPLYGFAYAWSSSMTCWTPSSKQYSNILFCQYVWTYEPVNCWTDGILHHTIYTHTLCPFHDFSCAVWNCTKSFWNTPDILERHRLRPASLVDDNAFLCGHLNWFCD